MGTFTDEQLATAMRNILDGTWKVRGQEIDTEIDLITVVTIHDKDWNEIANEYSFPKALRVALENAYKG